MKYAIITMLTLFISGCSVLDGGADSRPTRTFGTVWDDQMIESKGRVRIKKAHADLKEAHFNIVAYNGTVLLVGQVPSEEMKQLAADTLHGLQKVHKIYNELQIAGPTSIFSRTNDSWLTTKIKTKMVASKDVDASRIKVVTENGIVYLLGMVTKKESEAAVDLTRRVYGVQKVVKAFELIELSEIPDAKISEPSAEKPIQNTPSEEVQEELI